MVVPQLQELKPMSKYCIQCGLLLSEHSLDELNKCSLIEKLVDPSRLEE